MLRKPLNHLPFQETSRGKSGFTELTFLLGGHLKAFRIMLIFVVVVYIT